MKYVLMLFVFLTACTIDQSDIDRAAERQMNSKRYCAQIAESVGALSDFRRDHNEDAYGCYIYKKTNLTGPIGSFTEKELSTLSYYLFMKK